MEPHPPARPPPAVSQGVAGVVRVLSYNCAGTGEYPVQEDKYRQKLEGDLRALTDPFKSLWSLYGKTPLVILLQELNEKWLVNVRRVLGEHWEVKWNDLLVVAVPKTWEVLAHGPHFIFPEPGD